MDLSNFLFVRTREHMLLQNKVAAPHRVLKRGKPSMLTSGVTAKSLSMCQEELSTALPALVNMLYVLTPAEGKPLPDLPVAFASNVLYVLERNGLGNRDTYSRLLVPVLKQKAEYLHAEGIAQAAWALASAGFTDDAEVWGALKRAALKKEWTNQVVVKNERFSATLFRTQSGSEHIFQSELTEFVDQLFFRDHMNLFEAYNGFKLAHAANPQLGLDEAVKSLEQRFGDVILRKNDAFLELQATQVAGQKTLATV
jgi:hypothetical protein